MAYIKKSGSKFQVRSASNNKVVACFNSRQKADKKMRELHRIHKPKVSNRGKYAAAKWR